MQGLVPPVSCSHMHGNYPQPVSSEAGFFDSTKGCDVHDQSSFYTEFSDRNDFVKMKKRSTWIWIFAVSAAGLEFHPLAETGCLQPMA